MMETKLRTVLCALLLLLLGNLGSAEHGNDHAAASQSALGVELATEAPAADSTLKPSSHPAPAPNGSDTDQSSGGTGSLSGNATTDGETTSQAPEPKKDNDTNLAFPSASAVPENSSNLTEELTTKSPILLTESHTTTSHTSPTTTTTTTTTSTSPPHTAHNAPADTVTNNTSNDESISTSEQPTLPKTQSPTSAPTPEPPKPETTTTTTTTTTSTRSSSTSSTSSSRESQTLTPPHTSRTSHAPQDRAKSTSAPSSRPTAQAEAHADTPSQLNVGGDPMMVHESPTLDPLLAGLVTAFIVTAVIITLLLFLKLRRRDNRPEFRRLQDLPMDDMMEDTPLSMYNY
ncbi:cell wall protein DAN4 [Scophthalmus maximus]|uniref:cell wall protein DAN4 n=1 Tax=Scophthalmus maximus TaxID=52904 RepID=UPI001FA82DC5|nr:cell wall protein DAN4 [Scophthalmus maximus]